MESVKYRFLNLNTVIDEVHSLFEQWPSNEHDPRISPDSVQRTKLALHEWIANLVQHASFECSHPEIMLDVETVEDAIVCVVEDNSQGFDLDAHLVMAAEDLAHLPERGMGLLMLQACATDLFYGRISDGRNRLKFSVKGEDDPCLTIPF
ncbi:MAG: ATP-binding protein [Bacteroidetes bacterium]|nr:ATP-binding protein [Bacteroidota bacterium]